MLDNSNALHDDDELHAVYISLLKDHHLWQRDLQTALQLIATTCSQALGVDRASIWQKSVDGNTLNCRVLCENDICIVSPDLAITEEEHQDYFKAFDSERVIAADDAQTDTRTRSFLAHYFDQLDITSTLDATLRLEGTPTGIVRFEHTGPARKWTANEENFVISISDLLSQVVIYHSLRDSEDRYRKVFDSAGDAIIVMREYRMVDCNRAAFNLFHCTEEEFFKHPQSHFWPEKQPCGTPSKELAKKHFGAVFATGYQRFEWRLVDWYGRAFDTDISLTHVKIEGQAHLVVSIRDITDKKNASQQIRELNALQQAIFDGANYSIIATDELGLIHTFNRAAEDLLGYLAHEIIGKKTPDIFFDEEETLWRAQEVSEDLGYSVEANFEAYVAKTREGAVDEIECNYVRKDGSKVPVLLSVSTLRNADKEITGFLSIASDISERKEATEALLNSKREMEHRAKHDTLTGLPNRARLHDMARVAIYNAAKENANMALMLLDLNRFKDINDTLGHAAGDLMLKAIAMRLQNKTASLGATLYRLGGDEFAVLVDRINNLDDVATITETIIETLRKPIVVNEITLELGGSIGIAIYPEHGDNSHSLLRCADVAMYKAKSGSENAVFYQPEFDPHSQRRLTLMSELGAAIREDQLVLHFQPRVSIQKNACTGCEALLRWEHPKLGLIPPVEFIPFAEMSDFINPLSKWVLEKALNQIESWLAKGIEIEVAINLSAKNLIDPGFCEDIRQALERHSVPPHLLEIEITESALISDPEKALETINLIHQLGVKFAIDDFGTGYSSLSYLKRLPIDTLKIDRTFIADMLEDEQDAVIVKSTINLAHSFGLNVVAEGVEDAETLTALKFLSCEEAQGFLISKPLPVAEFEHWYSLFKTKKKPLI